MVKPLKLKSQKVGRPEAAESDPVLSVLVDNSIFHLDGTYDYLLPKKLEARVGDWVSVPFRSKNCLGLVVARSQESSITKLEFVNRKLKLQPITPEFIELYQAVAKRWAAPIFDVLRFVAKSGEKSRGEPAKPPSGYKGARSYLQLNSDRAEIIQVREIAERLAKEGPTLLIVPEARSAELLGSDKYEVAMRSGVLRPFKYRNLIILREESEHHYELKSPGFNSRDVALLRNERLGENLLFLGFSPSLEMASLIEKGYIPLKGVKAKTKVSAKPSLQGELIPSALLPKFKEYLSKGSVLVLVPAKGYGLAICCAKCRNIARCGCGGRLTKVSRNASPSCAICQKTFNEWKCSHCQCREVRLIGKGIDRIAEEFGKSFPNYAIHIATSEKQIEGPIPNKSIVLSTLGTSPNQIFSGVLFLEGFNLSADLRSSERALSNLMKYASLSNGEVMVVERPESSLVTSLIKWNPFLLLNRELQELRETNLPPYSRHLVLKAETSEIPRIYSGIQSAIRDGRLVGNLGIYNHVDKCISIFFPLREATKVLDFFLEFQRRRSMSGKKVLGLRVDPYLLG